VKTKDKRKPKRKRGQTMQTIDFLTPLSVEECMEHLESGHFPLKRWLIILNVDEDFQFSIGLVENINRVGFSYPQLQNPAPVWVEGSLTEQTNGLTHLTGRLQSESIYSTISSRWIRLAEISLIVFIVFVVSRQFILGYDHAPLTFFALIMAMAYLFFKAEEIRARRLARTLLAWLEDRLDVQRTK
jgi:hypothetical protein